MFRVCLKLAYYARIMFDSLAHVPIMPKIMPKIMPAQLAQAYCIATASDNAPMRNTVWSHQTSILCK